MLDKSFLNSDFFEFSLKITHWFKQNSRDLPWRKTTDPYIIWISEIILQQTRVNQGLDYFIRFVNRFPTVTDLAHADEDEVMKYWQGLGYYSRARNLHTAAIQIQTDYNGVFPTDYNAVLALKGIGEYTAAAVCSFAYNQPYAVLDGNVFRVLSRVFGLETPINTPKAKKEFSTLALLLLDKKKPAQHNQAIMEFGALQCVPASPDCSICPLLANCFAYNNKKVTELPVKIKNAKIKERYLNYFFVENKGFTYVKKRTDSDIWRNLYEFPLIESIAASAPEHLFETEDFKTMFSSANEIKIIKVLNPIKHVLTHRLIFAYFYKLQMNVVDDDLFLPNFTKISLSDLHDYPVSRLIEIFIEKELND